MRISIPVCIILIGVGLLLLEKNQVTLPATAPVVAPEVKPLTPNELLIQEGKRLGVLSLNGQRNKILQSAAEQHANFQAAKGVQSHQMWQQRMSVLQRQIPGLRFSEVANESWPRQSASEASIEMFKSWKQSTGHWSVVNGECKYYGIAMALGNNGTWYACEIVGR